MRALLVGLVLAIFISVSQIHSDPVSPDAISNIRINKTEKEELLRHIGQLAIPFESKEVFRDMLNSAFESDYLPPGIMVIDRNYEAICAKVVSRLFWAAFGNEDNLAIARGVSGNAWNMAWNVLFFGGQVFPWDAYAESIVRTGDIIGIYYRYSINNRIKKDKDYTHLALVIDRLPGRGALIAHWWNVPEQSIPRGAERPWFFRLEFLGDLLNDFPGFFILRELIRPRNVFIEE